MDEQTLGTFITIKRKERGITLRSLAKDTDISPVYLCNIEKGRRPMTNEDTLNKIAAVLLLSKEEKAVFLDLAAKTKNKPVVAADLPEYINERDVVRTALRTAQDVDATDEEWQEFINKLQKRMKKKKPEDNK
jgi:transcriptional regulator with XRE-family HTH domain